MKCLASQLAGSVLCAALDGSVHLVDSARGQPMPMIGARDIEFFLAQSASSPQYVDECHHSVIAFDVLGLAWRHSLI